MRRLQNSWELAKCSWGVLRSEKQLVWMPVLSFLLSWVVAGVFGVAIWATLGRETGVDGSDGYSWNVATIVLGFCLYVAVAFVQTYFLAALCAGANERLQGRDTTFGQALSVASSRTSRILPWAVLSATVSVILQAIEERFGFVGAIVAGLIGGAWNILTFLTVPIIVFEDLGPINALKRSGHLFKQTWGENLAAQVGFGLLGLLIMLPGVLVGVLGVVTGVGVLAVAGIAVGVVLILVGATVLAALSGIYRTALYRYAVDGVTPDPFSSIDFAHAFGPKRRGLSRA